MTELSYLPHTIQKFSCPLLFCWPRSCQPLFLAHALNLCGSHYNPYQGERHRGCPGRQQSIVAGGYPAELLEAAEKALDHLALPVAGPIDPVPVSALLAAWAGDCGSLPSGTMLAGQHNHRLCRPRRRGAGAEPLPAASTHTRHRRGCRDHASCPGPQRAHPCWHRSADGALVVLPPRLTPTAADSRASIGTAPCWCTLICVLSRQARATRCSGFSPATSPASCAAMTSHTPRRLQRKKRL